MKVLFSKKGSQAYLADKERLIFGIDNSFFDASGNEVAFDPGSRNGHNEDDKDEGWYQDWMK